MQRRSATRNLALISLAGVVAALAGSWALSGLTGFGPREWALGAEARTVGRIDRLELELDLRHPPEIRGVATLHGLGADEPAVEFLLNRSLVVDRVTEAGVECAWRAGPGLRSAYHQEARVVRVTRPARGDTSGLRIEYSGRGLDGTEGRDWMGVLLLAPDELRMSVQTAFHPQFGADRDGPGVAPLLCSLRVLAPEGFEVHAPGRRLESHPVEGGTAWRFEADRPTVLSVFAAPRVRRETELGDARVVTLLRDEHAHLGEDIAHEARRILATYAALWGPIGAHTLGVCEIDCRGDSYNWAAQGIVTIDRHAFDQRLPVAQLAHEIAHLWWGQEVVVRGRGERFLTESLAEYAAWRHRAAADGEGAAREAADEARTRWLATVHEHGTDPALADVSFSTPGYAALAYAKGPLALLAIEHRIGRAALDAVLRQHRAASGAGATLASFLDALRQQAGDPALVAPWIERPGHAHLALDAVGAADGRAHGVVVSARCPAGCAELVPPEVEVGARWPGRSETIRVPPSGPRSRFDAAWSPSPSIVEIDPRELVLGERGSAVYQGPARLLSTDPAPGIGGVALGPLSLRLVYASQLGPVPEDAAARIQRASNGARPAARSSGDVPALTVRSVCLEEDGRTLRVDVDGTRPGREHTLVVPAGTIRDADGFPLPAEQLTFTTRASEAGDRPRIVSSEPADGARDVPRGLERIRVVFSEPMRPISGFKKGRIAELEREGWAFPQLGRTTWEDDRTLSWTLGRPLEAGRGYGLPFDQRYFDLEGDELVGFELRFTTSGP